MDIYEPAEDSYLLQKWVRQYASGRILDMGTGSGIQALTAIQHPGVREVVAADINPEAVAKLREKVRLERIRKLMVMHSDLFEQVQGHFNLIIFNPPYLPQDKGVEDGAIYGGKKGWEMIERFLEQVSAHLFPEGKILLLFSSLTNREKVENLVTHRLFEFQLLEEKKLAIESLYVYEIQRSALLRELERRGIQQAIYFAKGKRGVVYKGILDQNVLVKSHFSGKRLVPVAIKVERNDSEAQHRLENEAKWLQIVNKEGIGPRFLFAGANYVVYEFVEGKVIEEWLATADTEAIIFVLENVLEQCVRLDRLGVTKDEMHRPIKHILVTDKNRSVLIDFERCTNTDRPKNVTQFVEYICRIGPELEKKGLAINVVQLRSAAQEYRKNKEVTLANKDSGEHKSTVSSTVNYIKSLLRGNNPAPKSMNM